MGWLPAARKRWKRGISSAIPGLLLLWLLPALAAGQSSPDRRIVPASPAAPRSVANTVPGTMKEQVKVDQNGAFNFKIPIEVPPGIAGMEPQLLLSYNSQQSNGFLGMGWSLTGLPTVERIKRIRAVDEVNGTIAYNANDRFSYAGQRLIVTTGDYGARRQRLSHRNRELEHWSRRMAAPAQGRNISLSQTKDNRTYEFGNTPIAASSHTAVPIAPCVPGA